MSNVVAMNEGDGAHSYVQNSKYQKGAIEAAEKIIKEEIAKQLDIKQLYSNSTQTIRIADFGCSTGPNTFLAVQSIIDAVIKKYETEGLISQSPDFQVFFNDNIFNDFNTLFASLPPERQYYAAGVPGSFYMRLFPKASLHFAYSSSALHWLSELPNEITDEKSPAWNKGKITYEGSKKEVFDAYATQFGKDFDTFLNARAEELVSGGLMALVLHAVPNHLHHSHSTTTITEVDLLGSCLMDMAKMGKFDEAMVDSFNVPVYFTFPNELKVLLERNKYFNVERMEILNNLAMHITMPNPKSRALYFRAALEGVLVKHFGSEIMDELFNRYASKVAEASFVLDPSVQKTIFIFVLLKRMD